MKLYADLHIHSHFSRATSKTLDFEHLAQWAQIKGVHVVGTGDISHPGWLEEMREKFEPAEDGLFRLRPELESAVQAEVPHACHAPVRFLLAGEISNIYKRHDAVRKVHNVLFAPSLEAVAKLQVSLEQIGNIRSDGRPILGLDSRDLLEITLETDPRCHFIPAHIWTPWFSMLGSKSGFDSVEECFGDLTDHIFALETGLSSDPPMNWRVSDLDRYTLVSNSDAHSPQKLAREATVFHTELAYDALFDALYSGDPERFGGTVEFFPEEGKYHLDGHRKCGVVWEPAATRAHDGLCSVCGKKVTVGVMHRVDELADRPVGGKPARTHAYVSLVPLPEVLGEVHGVGPNSKTVQRAYFRLLDALGPELAILQDVPLEDIEDLGGGSLAEGIERMRSGQVMAQGGYDGEYGVIKVLPGENDGDAQEGLFPVEEAAVTVETLTVEEATPTYGDPGAGAMEIAAPVETGASYSGEWTALPLFELPATVPGDDGWLARLNEEQRSAVECTDAPLIVSAGPGTGKTRTLTVRIAHLVRTLGVPPEEVLAITFTNKAAEEMADRMVGLIGEPMADRLTISTFHAFGALLLRRYGDSIGVSSDFAIAGESEQRALLRRSFPDWSEREATRYAQAISHAKSRLLSPDSRELEQMVEELPSLREAYASYTKELSQTNLLDFDDLVLRAVRLLENDEDVRAQVHARYRWISVDEYQDVNLAQYRLLRLLAMGGANLCVIGDPDQAIYGFRGADHRYFLAFDEDFADARTIHLHRSYRSPQTLLDAASQVIARNADGDAVSLVSDFAHQVKLDVYCAPTDRAEAEYIVHTVEQMVGGTSYFSLDSGRVDDAGVDAAEGTRTFGDFAVLYRLNAQGAALIEAFDRSGIPYQCASKTSPYSRPETRTLLAYLWLLHAPNSRLHWEAILDGCECMLPDSDRTRAWNAAQERGESAAAAFSVASEIETVQASQREKLQRLSDFWRVLEESAGRTTVSELLLTIMQFLSAEENGAVMEPEPWFDHLVRDAQPFGDDRASYLEAIALHSEADHIDPRADRVALMTLHAAKGLEFPVVFMAGCEEGLIPYLPESDTRTADLDEERRLFYVGMTRAQDKLFMTRARRRFHFGRRREFPVSPYLSDIETALLEVHEGRARPSQGPSAADLQMSLF